ncbi:MOSC domain-containing protein [Rhodococcus sp. 06-418-5]|uniref:MOSC domain-containing protein n=1 Tax=unclassified Rhodococcus (in: high G+C Gram-positive bacteria) TaxID=192944 RepID=UPI000B9A8EBA|nr:MULTISPECIES: MOSC N-terminal beta barrel domain-containing protein [unclassified Rhodococcus (in: high G+C Gram-positive bacteria)]OZC56934.1 MOSC domain-containing protein [Rhodococcus sp. 06-470-2]OZC73298.1 MOSC domain-containing protein [Rhodococcus sp. 06-418-5]OZE65619.1 MOSC domain-containing protein [Rhodococcus sp. 05-2221-1B]
MRVSSLVTYPVKGCAGAVLDAAQVSATGLEHDRSFMIVDADGAFRSQRTDPVLAVVRCSVGDGTLTLEHDTSGSVTVSVDRDSAARDITMFRSPMRGIDQGDDVADWLTDVIGEPSRLVAAPRDLDRVTDGIRPGSAQFADSSAVHILSTATLAGLNSRLDVPLPMDRFRPNIVVDGWDSPHREDEVRDVTIGGARLAYTKLAIRCAVTTVEQSTGVRTGPEPLRTLGDYRRGRQKGVAFGSKFSVVQDGTVTVGDELHVASWGESEL